MYGWHEKQITTFPAIISSVQNIIPEDAAAALSILQRFVKSSLLHLLRIVVSYGRL